MGGNKGTTPPNTTNRTSGAKGRGLGQEEWEEVREARHAPEPAEMGRGVLQATACSRPWAMEKSGR